MTSSSLAAKILGRCEADGDCLLWTGARNGDGYGVIRDGIRFRLTHRVVLEHRQGLLTPGLEVDHTCGNRLCIIHLEEVTHLVNMRRAIARKKGATDGAVRQPDERRLDPVAA